LYCYTDSLISYSNNMFRPEIVRLHVHPTAMWSKKVQLLARTGQYRMNQTATNVDIHVTISTEIGSVTSKMTLCLVLSAFRLWIALGDDLYVSATLPSGKDPQVFTRGGLVGDIAGLDTAILPPPGIELLPSSPWQVHWMRYTDSCALMRSGW
jgi:hypothetical protein